jgi:opacity protein-like surface antigen
MCTRSATLTAVFALLAAAASAQPAGAPADAPDFARTGIYAGIGGTYAPPSSRDGDFYNDIDGVASDASKANGTANLEVLKEELGLNQNALLDAVDVTFTSTGGDLDDGPLGINAFVGYRIHEHVAFEVEGEWLAGSNETSFVIDNTGDTGSAKVKDVWTATSNVKLFPWTGRLQPFLLIGIGAHHSALDVDAATSGLETTASVGNTTVKDPDTGEDLLVPADFTLESSEKVTGAIRVGLGADIYANRHVAVELKADYVYPFRQVGNIKTDYYSLGWRLLYRF